MKINSVPDSAAMQAIEWMVLLRSGEATPDDFSRFIQWRQADAANDIACSQIEATLGKIQNLTETLPSEDIQKSLLAPSGRRKFLQGSFCFAAVVGCGAVLFNQEYSLGYLFSDAKTNTAQLTNVELDDGSTVNLNARSAIDINYTSSTRGITLLHGGAIANIVNDYRPFILHTSFGQILALNSRLHVRHESDGVHLAVLDNVAKVTTNKGATTLLRAGHGVWFDDSHVTPVAINSQAETAWLQGKLEVNNASLASVITAIRDYTPSFIHVDSSVRNLRVSGVFPLNNIPYTLDSLAQTMPIAITRTTNYLIQILPA